MENYKYEQLAARTDGDEDFYREVCRRLAENPTLVRLLHVSLGLCTEAGEFADALKKHLFYNKPIDMANLSEELGDSLWYTSRGCNVLGEKLSQVMDTNINKLKVRFPQKFDTDKAVNRDLKAERKVIEWRGEVRGDWG